MLGCLPFFKIHTLPVFFNTYCQVQFFIITFITALAHLLYRADGDTRSTGNDEVAVLDVWSDLIQHERNDVWLHSKEQNIAFANCLFVACGEVDTQFLHIKRERELMCQTQKTQALFKYRNMTDYSSNSIIDGIRRADCTHPQSLHCGEISVRGTGCDFVSGNHPLKSRENSHKHSQ